MTQIVPQIQTDILEKPSAFIHMEHPLKKANELAWNGLLHNAQDIDQESHSITFNEIRKISPAIRTIKKAKEVLEDLVEKKVRYNLLGRDAELQKEGIFSLLAGYDYDYETKTFTYSFAHNLKNAVKQAGLFAKLDMALQSKYSGSKYGWRIYELCADFIQVGQTHAFPLVQFKRILGLKDDQHPQFKTFNRDVIKRGVKDCNKETNLTVEAVILFDEQTKKATGVYFKVATKAQEDELTIELENHEGSYLPTEFHGDSDIYRELLHWGISQQKALSLFAKFREEHITKVLRQWRGNLNSGLFDSGEKITDKAGLLTSKIEKEDQMTLAEVVK